MCVGCTIQYGPSAHSSLQLGYGWQFRGFWGSWYNFIPPKYRLWELLIKSKYDHSREKDKYWYYQQRYRPWRGEGSPEPWFMIWKNDVFGLQVGLTRYRGWFHPELTPMLTGSRQLMWGFFILAWKYHDPQPRAL